MEQFLQQDSQTLLEHYLLISLTALIVSAILTLLSAKIKGAFSSSSDAIEAITCSSARGAMISRVYARAEESQALEACHVNSTAKLASSVTKTKAVRVRRHRHLKKRRTVMLLPFSA